MAKLRLGFGVIIIFAFILTLVALFTPGWRSYQGDGAPDFGLVSHYCGDGNRKVNDWDCSKWAYSKASHEKVTLGLVIVACVLQAVAIGCFFALFSPRVRLGIPTAGICALAFLCLFIAILVYGVRYRSKVAYMTSMSYELLANIYLGYAYWIAVVATLFTLLAAVVAGGMIGDHRMPID
ncbi:hypothetical protein ANCDUO_15677 [Ancylostoma duodenale]|uniref:Clc-like protein n=1 Tax=Ancylostoma duodenale TaxID=51022 RepID=A0A0C2CCX3_9BILA|nr:hypothetical protein ANCDUO_15677 [Ancylostoma duodenale]